MKNFAERAKALVASRNPRTADVAKLISEAKLRLEEIEREMAELSAKTEAIETDEDDALAADQQASRLGFHRRRTLAWKEQLEAIHGTLMESERRKTVEAEYEAARIERDALAARIRREVPAALDTLASALDAMRENTDRLRRINANAAHGLEPLQDAETIARPKLGAHMPRLSAMVLPRFEDGANLWPRSARRPSIGLTRAAIEQERKAAEETERLAEARWQSRTVRNTTGGILTVKTRDGVKAIKRGGSDTFVIHEDEAERLVCEKAVDVALVGGR